MVDEISPNYYAEYIEIGDYVLHGSGFHGIPDDALGIVAFSNDTPLEYINEHSDYGLYGITRKNKTEMTLTQKKTGANAQPSYLGAIVSADRQTIYWTNNTRPLP